MTTKSINFLVYPFAILLATLLLAACGGGGGGSGSGGGFAEPSWSQPLVLSSQTVVVRSISGGLVTVRLGGKGPPAAGVLTVGAVTATITDLSSASGKSALRVILPTVLVDAEGNEVRLASSIAMVTLNTPVEVELKTLTVQADKPDKDKDFVLTLTTYNSVTATSSLAMTVILGDIVDGNKITLPQGSIAVIQTITTTITKTESRTKIVSTVGVQTITMRDVKVLAVAHNGQSYFYRAGDGDWRALSNGLRMQLQAAGIILPAISITGPDGVKKTIHYVYEEGKDTVVASVTVITGSDGVKNTIHYVHEERKNTVIASVTLYGKYVSITMTTKTTTEVKEVRITAYDGGTLYWSSDGLPLAVVLPPPNPSDGKDYETAEYLAYNNGNSSYLKNIKASAAYERGYFGQGVTIAIVDTGMLTSHVEFAERVVPGYDVVSETSVITDSGGHGTGVAGVAGAGMGQGDMQGVAPSVMLMPLKISDERGILTGDKTAAFRFALERNVQVINNSYARSFGDQGSYVDSSGNRVSIRFYRPFFFSPTIDARWLNTYKRDADEVNSAVANKDVVLVWGAGNNGWNSETGSIKVCDVSTIQTDPLCLKPYGKPYGYVPLRQLISTFVSDKTKTGHDWSTLNISLDAVSPQGYAPIFNSGLFGRWVVAVATDSNDRIASFSNACGEAMHWCLAAPGVYVRAPSSGGTMAYGNASGTSYAAPYVSGGLAVLKSRYPHMPMNAILAIMLKTATDLGDKGVDAVYGHGLLNLEAAVKAQGEMNIRLGGEKLAGSKAAASLGKSSFSRNSGFSALRNYVSSASVAVSYLDNSYYYDTPLSNLVLSSGSKAPSLGGAAAALLSGGEQSVQMIGGLSAVLNRQTGRPLRVAFEAPSWGVHYNLCADCEAPIWKLEKGSDGFGVGVHFSDSPEAAEGVWRFNGGVEAFSRLGFAESGNWEAADIKQAGFRWRNALSGGNLSWLAELSQIQEDGGFLGNRGKAFGVSGAKTSQARLGLQSSWGNWRWLGEYRYGETAGKVTGQGLITEMSDLRYHLWSLELLGRSLWRGDDEFRFGLAASPKTQGRFVLRHWQAGSAEMVDDLKYSLPTSIREVKSVVSESGVDALVWRLGYKVTPYKQMDAALGLEYYQSSAAEDEVGVSFEFRYRL